MLSLKKGWGKEDSAEPNSRSLIDTRRSTPSPPLKGKQELVYELIVFNIL